MTVCSDPSVVFIFEGMFVFRYDEGKSEMTVHIVATDDPKHVLPGHIFKMVITENDKRTNKPIREPITIITKDNLGSGVSIYIEGADPDADRYGDEDVEPSDDRKDDNSYGWILSMARHHPNHTIDKGSIEGSITIRNGYTYTEQISKEAYYLLHRDDADRWCGRRALIMGHCIEMEDGQSLRIEGGPEDIPLLPKKPTTYYSISVENRCEVPKTNDFPQIYEVIRPARGDEEYELYPVIKNPKADFNILDTELFPCIMVDSNG